MGTCRRKLIEAMQQGDHALLESLAGAEKAEAGPLPAASARRASLRRHSESSHGCCDVLRAVLATACDKNLHFGLLLDAGCPDMYSLTDHTGTQG